MEPRKATVRSPLQCVFSLGLGSPFPPSKQDLLLGISSPYWVCMTQISSIHTYTHVHTLQIYVTHTEIHLLHTHTHTLGKFTCIMWANTKVLNLAERRNLNLCCLYSNKSIYTNGPHAAGSHKFLMNGVVENDSPQAVTARAERIFLASYLNPTWQLGNCKNLNLCRQWKDRFIVGAPESTPNGHLHSVTNR